MVEYNIEETKNEYIIIANKLNPRYVKTIKDVMMGGLTIESGIATYMGYPPLGQKRLLLIL